MTESEYLERSHALFEAMLDLIEREYPDLDVFQQGAILEVENLNGDKLILNQQSALQEVWLASRAGGYHFKWQQGDWLNTRDQRNIYDYLHEGLALLVG